MSALARFRLITFDCTNTLLKFRTSPAKKYGEIGALFGVRCNNNDLARNFKANWIKMNHLYPHFGRQSSLMDWQQWWKELISSTFSDSGAHIPEDKINNFSKHLLDLYETATCWEHCNGCVDLLNYLRMQQQLEAKNNANQQAPFVMGVLANFDPRLVSLLQNLKIDDFFEFAINSYDSNMEKPNSDIFNLAINTSAIANLRPEQCLHIGDGPITDYIAAKAAGWSAALIHEKNASYLQNKYGEDRINKDHVFASLFDFHKKLVNNSIKW